MTDHAQQPKLCPDCEIVAHAIAEDKPTDEHVYKLCAHAEGGRFVIGIGAKRGGRIACWDLRGPMTEAEADAIGPMLIAAMLSAGMKARPITKQ